MVVDFYSHYNYRKYRLIIKNKENLIGYFYDYFRKQFLEFYI